MDQMKDEIENLKSKISGKNSTIKTLKDDLAGVKKDAKEVERKYGQECRIVQSLKNELRGLEQRHEEILAAASSANSPAEKDKRTEETRRAPASGAGDLNFSRYSVQSLQCTV